MARGRGTIIIARSFLAIAAATAALSVPAWDPQPPPAADPHLMAPPTTSAAPTAFACTVETLVSGKTCVFEGTSPATDPAQARTDAKRLAEDLCAQAARRSAAEADATLIEACRRDIAEKARRCAGNGVLLDVEGRFLPAARACYATLEAALAEVRFMDAATTECCRCAVENGCAPVAEACNRLAARGTVERPVCVAKSCATACEALLPLPPEREPSPPAPSPASSPRREPTREIVPAAPGTKT